MLKLSILSVIVLGSATLSVYTGAGSSTSTMNVSVSVEHSCSIESSPMAFGAYNGVMANASIALEAKSTVVSTCTSGAGALVTINAGASAGSGSAGAPLRRMTAGEGHCEARYREALLRASKRSKAKRRLRQPVEVQHERIEMSGPVGLERQRPAVFDPLIKCSMRINSISRHSV